MSWNNLTPICDPEDDDSQDKDTAILPADAVLAEQALPPSPRYRQKHFIQMSGS